MAEQEIGRVSHMARQTLAFYHDTSAPAPVDLPLLMREVVELYGAKLRLKRIEVTENFVASKSVVGLRGELKQLLANLIANALDAMAAGGRLVLSVADSGQGVLVTIAVTGEGIDEENLPRLFEPFFTTKKDIGTGLGLWVSKGIAEKHGGKITVESSTDRHNHGTTFRVYLNGSCPKAAVTTAGKVDDKTEIPF